jgi:capsular polysaccharide biosynthesis protein
LGCLAPASIQLIDEFAAPLRQASSAMGEKLYVSREKAKRRRLTNEPKIWDALEKRGFVKLRLEELTWSQQISAFRAAKVIVAPHGAGLANLAFASPGTKVVELFHRSYVNGCYWQLASLKGLDYHPLVPEGPESITRTLRANRLDVTADVAQILAALG